jgi:hypothetical protein
MTMQYDVKNSYIGSTGATISGQLVAGRARLKQIVFAGNGTAGTLILYDGTDTTGNIIWQSKTTAGAQPFQVIIPGEGILAYNGIYASGTNVLSISICYG